MQHAPESCSMATEHTTEWSVPIFVPSGPLRLANWAPWRTGRGEGRKRAALLGGRSDWGPRKRAGGERGGRGGQR
eukprot:5602582-Pyramimonas_sp.AAC.1